MELKPNILLVDDQPDGLLALEAVLENLDANLVKASSGEETLKCMLDQDFAVILLDAKMPGMDGFETAKLIRERDKFRNTPIFFHSAVQKTEEFVRRAHEVGAIDYIFKPIIPEILKAKVKVFVELYQLKQLEDALSHDEDDIFEELSEDIGAPGILSLSDAQNLSKFEPEYNDIIIHYIQAIRDESNRPMERIKRLAERFAALRVDSRQVVRLHLKVLDEIESKLSADRGFAHDARLVLVAIQGSLLDTYRKVTVATNEAGLKTRQPAGDYQDG